MSPEIIGIIGIVVLLVLIFARMHIGLAMAIVGFIGCVCLQGIGPAFKITAIVPYSNIAFYPISAIPMFVFMGVILSNTGVSGDLYSTAHKWLGHVRGGLAMASVFASAGLAAMMGDSVAETITMGKVAVPEMKKYNYDMSLATGCVAAGGSLGILIPPSMGFIMYGILTGQPIGSLFMAGIIPGILLSALFIVTIIILTARYTSAGPKTSFKEKVVSLKNTWHTLILILLVLGGIYGGVFTPTEAGAVGVFGAIVIAAVSQRLTLKGFRSYLEEATRVTAMVMLLIIGAFIFMKFLAVSKLSFTMGDLISHLATSRYVIFAGIMALYIVLGMFLDVFAAIALTIPVIYPVITALGFDPIWYGVVMVLLMEMGLVTPPIGFNIFALGAATDVPLHTIFRGAAPFAVAMIVCVIILTIFPQIVLFIPSMM